MQNTKSNSLLILAGVIVVGIFIFTAGALQPRYAPLTAADLKCPQAAENAQAIASIANSTGKLPGGFDLAYGQTVHVNPNYCKNPL